MTIINLYQLPGTDFFVESLFFPEVIVYLGHAQKVTPDLAAKADRLSTNNVAAIQVSDVFLSLALI